MGHDEENFGKKTFFITSSYFPEITLKYRKTKKFTKSGFWPFRDFKHPHVEKSVDQDTN